MFNAEQRIGRRRERCVYLGLIGLAILVLVIGVLGLIFLWQPDSRARLGNIHDLAIGLPIAIKPEPQANQRKYSASITNLPLYLVRSAESEVLVFVQRDPRSGCEISWQLHEKRFIDPCHGSAYTITGKYVRGPSGQDLNRIPVEITRDGSIMLSSYALLADLTQ